jgi:hypothetical protein
MQYSNFCDIINIAYRECINSAINKKYILTNICIDNFTLDDVINDDILIIKYRCIAIWELNTSPILKQFININSIIEFNNGAIKYTFCIDE